MTVSLVQRLALISIFNCPISGISTNNRYNLIRNFVSMLENLLLFYLEGVYITVITLLYIFVFLLYHRDIEPNPGLKKLKKNSLSVCYWNLNSLSAHNFLKLTQMKAYISMYKHGFICLSETYLDSSTPDGQLETDRYNLVRETIPIISKEICIYYKESLPARVIILLYLKEALLLEMTYNKKKVIVSVIYHSLGQGNSEFDLFLSNFEKILSDINK